MTDYEIMQKLIADADSMIAKDITSDDAEFMAWQLNAKRLLNKRFGKDGIEMSTFLGISFYNPVISFNTTEAEEHRIDVQTCHKGLKQAKAIFQTYLDELSEDDSAPKTVQTVNYSKVFIVHGHDGELKESVARIIEKQGIEAIILSEQANQGKTIIEKFEIYSDVGGAICLYTADDIGRANAESSDHFRARQNVVFETGYFIGKLGRDHIVILADKGIEMPSDLSGVVRTNTGNWQFELLKEMKAMGYVIDLNLLF